MNAGNPYTMDEVAKHTGRDSLWLVMKNKVYDVTEYIDKHPGGPDKFLVNAGTDVTQQFERNHQSKIPQFIAQNYEIGFLRRMSLKEKQSVGKATENPPKVLTITPKEEQKSEAQEQSEFDYEYTLSANACSLIREQFAQLATVANGLVEAGILIYDALFTALGDSRTMFKSPKRVLGFRLISQVERCINHVEEKEYLETELYNLSMRHLAYATYDQMRKIMPLFVNTILGVLTTALDEYWTADSFSAWNVFFSYMAAHLLRNAREFGGKVNLLRSSWQRVEELQTSSKNNQKVDTNSTGGFGDALYFNLGVMSPEIMSLIIRDRSELAEKLTDGFRMLVSFVSNPPVLNEELYVLSARHLDYGAQEHHFPVFGQAVMVTLRSLLPRSWNWAHEDAWGWLWNMASTFMIKTIANGHAHTVALDESMQRLSGVDMNELGMTFYGSLFASSIEVQQYFYKPNSLIQFIVTKVIQIISTVLHFPDAVTQNIRALGMRHIKYAIPPDLFPLFGDALNSTLPCFLEGFWDEDIREAWESVFNFVKDCMTRAVMSGTNLVTKALVNNSAAECEDALGVAPRSERLMWVLEIDVSNIKVSPFKWALQDGKFEVAKFMLEDALKIRADREAYYYGKDELFRVHPDLVEMLTRLAPNMLFIVFDGLMWHSRNITDGRRRVNYYIEHLYGDPTKKEYEDCFATPLAHLTKLYNSDVFTHPFTIFLIDMKWTQFARSVYQRMQLMNVLTLLFFMLGWVIFDEKEDVAFGFRIAAMTCVAIVLCWVQLPRIAHEILKLQVTPVFWRLYVPVFLSKLSNILRFIANLITVVAFATDVNFFEHDDVMREVSSWCQALACCILFTLLIETAQLSVVLLKFLHQLSSVGLQFIIYLLSIIFFLGGFSSALYLSEGRGDATDAHFGSVWNSALNLVGSIFGTYSFQLERFSVQMLLFYVVFCLFCIFFLSRLIFAIMSTINLEQDQHVQGFSILQRAQLTVEVESTCSLEFRTRIWRSMDMEKPIEFDAGDLGPSGGVQVQEIIGRQVSKSAVDDRITRYPGACDPSKPWPRIVLKSTKDLEAGVVKLAENADKIRRSVSILQKLGVGAKGGTMPTLSEGDSGAFGNMSENASNASEA